MSAMSPIRIVMHSGEKCVEIDRHVRQCKQFDLATLNDLSDVVPVELSSPGSQRSFVRMETPDLLVAATLILGELGIYVIVPGRARPNLGDEGQCRFIDFEQIVATVKTRR